MLVCGIDPGPEESAFVMWDGERILQFGNWPNHELLERDRFEYGPSFYAIEQIRGFGVPAGNSTFDTCMWTGRFLQAFGEKRTFWVPRKLAAAHICGIGGLSKDSFVRQGLIDRFGGNEAIGSKKAPGPLYGLKAHHWAALAVAITFWDQNPELRKGLFA